MHDYIYIFNNDKNNFGSNIDFRVSIIASDQITEAASRGAEKEMTQYVGYGTVTKKLYVEGDSQPSVIRKVREVTPKLIEPVIIRRADAYYAEVDAKE
ncbi:hypothetical protein VXN63_02315 [Marinilactibacillus sp. XAAS-LB27]|uniref:hypothetical protein n=1 Tax=Marinilactibacillus sp. XAAS-LB27 TaxID=3114538 RepID=UPI002E19693D|nr:hypothetical protein [Marinilactibacillus sp. XAAS-LB27]